MEQRSSWVSAHTAAVMGDAAWMAKLLGEPVVLMCAEGPVVQAPQVLQRLHAMTSSFLPSFRLSSSAGDRRVVHAVDATQRAPNHRPSHMRPLHLAASKGSVEVVRRLCSPCIH